MDFLLVGILLSKFVFGGWTEQAWADVCACEEPEDQTKLVGIAYIAPSEAGQARKTDNLIFNRRHWHSSGQNHAIASIYQLTLSSNTIILFL